ncbi:MAG: hypothetical protein ACO3LB_08305 [Flavobacteriaceae bacterium]
MKRLKKNKPSYKYTTTFEAEVFSCDIGGGSFISKASLENLESLIPKGVNFEDNIDLLGVAFNAAVVNKFNKNGDGIDSKTAIEYTKNFIHKPTNIEHDKDKIVGHIASAGWSEYGTSRIMTAEELEGYTKPFNIALGALVYKSANSTFADAVEKSVDPKQGSYHSISTSWEVGFSDFVLAVGSEYLEEARIISDRDEMEEMVGCLKSFGGCGKTDKGEPVNRLITGKIYPLGIGYTTNPAADVKGIYMKSEDKSPIVINDKRDKNISHCEKTNVNLKKNNSMETEKVIDELKDLLADKKFSQEAIASMTSTFADAIKEKDEEFRAELTKSQEEKEALANEHAELKTSVEDLKSKFEEAQTKIAEYEAAIKAEQAIARFNERMDVLDQKFDLEDEDKEFLAKELKDVDEAEEAFASFEEKLSILWKHKSKEAKAEFEKQIEARIQQEVEKRISKPTSEPVEEAVASKTDEEILDGAETTEAAIANSNEDCSREEQTIKEKFSAAFDRSNIEIS